MNLLDFPLFPEEVGAPLHTTFVPSCVQKPALPPLPDMVLHFLELPQYDQHNAPTSTALEKWLYFITRRGRRDAMEDPVMKQILEESPDIAAWSAPEGACSAMHPAEAERRLSGSFLALQAAVRPSNQEFVADEQLRSRLDARDKFVRTHAQLLRDAEQRGLEQGIEKGREEEREKRRETARKMKRDGLNTADIARYTDLSEEEIREL